MYAATVTDRPLGLALALLVVALVILSAYGPRPAAPAGGVAVPTGNSGSPLPSGAVSAPTFGATSTIQVAPAFVPTAPVSALRPFPSQEPMSVAVGLAPTDPSAVSGLLSALYSPGSPQYHDFLSTSALAERFGPSPPALASAESYFERSDLQVTVSPDHLLLLVSGPSARLASAFGTSFEEYDEAAGGWFVSHPTAASLPAIAPWSGVYGLGNRTPLVPESMAAPTLRPAVGPLAGCAAGGTDLAPCQIWQAYNMTSLISGGTDGSGVRVAVVDAYSSAEPQSGLSSDLSTFAMTYGLSVGSVNFVYPDPAPGDLNVSTNVGWNLEDALDLEWARAAAPGASIDMTFSPNAGVGLYEAVDWLVAHQAVNVISMSWGEPDVGIFNAYNQPCSVACNASTDGSYGILSPILADAAAEGISVFAASGDCGSADGTSGVATNYPASDPDVTGVGGTVLSVTANGWSGESAWSGNATGAQAPGCQNQGGSGGGYAPFPRPWWQETLAPKPTGRGVPDVALDAANPVAVVLNGRSVGVEGTSLSTPVWAGIAAIGDQLAGGPLGFLNPSIYRIAAGNNYSVDFHDIVQGENGYSAGPGWDPVTGLGSPRVASLVSDLAHPGRWGTSTVQSYLYATPRLGTAPLTVTFRVVITGGTGSYPLQGVSFGDGNASFAPNGTATYTYRVAGVYSAQAYAADSQANYSLSAPLAIVVGGGGPLNVTLTASTVTPTTGSPVTFSVGVVGGTPPYEYNFSFGDGTFLDGATGASTSHVFGAAGSFCAAVVVEDAATPPDGGSSNRVSVGVGGASLPNCRNDSVPLTVSPLAGIGVRDAPADFPALFSVSGGAGSTGGLPASLQYSSSDPYIAACECTIFRGPGNYTVTGYANDSEDEAATAQTTVDVAPPLTAHFTAGPTTGVAPLTVIFQAIAAGGDGGNAADTVWNTGNGTELTGASVSYTYSSPGSYVAVGHLADSGDGNASEAFLIDVEAADVANGASPLPLLTATVAPAVDVGLGTTVNVTAAMYSARGVPIASDFAWSLPDGFGAFASATNWTFSVPPPGQGNRTLDVRVTAIVLPTGPRLNETIALSDFVALEPGAVIPRVNALNVSLGGTPRSGLAPLAWSGMADASGPGTLSSAWRFGDGGSASGALVDHVFAFGRYTASITTSDSWGDHATGVLPIASVEPITLTVRVVALPPGELRSVAPAPPAMNFTSNVSGGIGPPFVYRWTFGDGTESQSPNVTHAYVSAGVYRVVVTVSDLNNDSRNMTINLQVNNAGQEPPPPWDPGADILAGGALVGVATAVVVVVARRRRPPGQSGVTP
jgi:PKD repeat protein